MNRTIVCVETSELFTGMLEKVADAEGDRLLLVTNKPQERARASDLVLDVGGDPGAVADIIRAHCQDAPVAAVLTSDEKLLPRAAAVSEALGVSRNTIEAINAARNKAQMKRLWQAAGVRTPSGQQLTSAKGLDPEQFTYPVIVKPVLGFASCGVRRVESGAELLSQLRKIGLFNATVISREGGPSAGFLVEQCLEGPEYAVETVWFDGEPVSDFIFSRNWGAAATGPWFPDLLYVLDETLPERRREEILDLAHRAVRALGLSYGPTHTEIRFHDDKPYVLESAARTGGGGVLYEIMDHAHGLDLARQVYMSQVCADREEFDRRVGTREWRAAPAGSEYFLYYMPYEGSGVVERVVGWEDLERRTEVLWSVCLKGPGSYLHPYDDLNSDYFASVIGCHVNRPGGASLQDLMDSLRTSVRIEYA
jgi:carbamoylphosphate synthase large subunit